VRRLRPPRTLTEASEDIRADYNAAKVTRLNRSRPGIAPTGSGADYHYRSESDYLRLLEFARAMDRNDTVIGQMLDRAVTNTVQDGMRLDPDTGDKKLDADLAARWKEYADDPTQCDIAAERTFGDMEWAVLRARMLDGDVFAIGTEDGGLQFMEAHRCRTPTRVNRANLVHGVEMNGLRRPLRYWFTIEDIDPFKATVTKDFTQYPAFDDDGYRIVFHIKSPKRITQARGVTAFAPIYQIATYLDDINFAKVVQQQVASCFAVFHEFDIAAGIGNDVQTGERETETLGDGSTRTIEGISPGMHLWGEPGEKLQGFSPNVPNPEYFPHVKLIITLISINIGMPLVLSMLDASETNFSGWRGAVDQARMGFRLNQTQQIRQFNTPVYSWKVRQWLAGDAAMRKAAGKSKVRILNHKWQAPTWPYIEPLKDASADLLRVRNGLISPRRLHAERGREWEEIAREIVEDNVLAISAAMKAAAVLNASAPEGQQVHWREVLSLPTPDGVSVKLAESASNSGGNDAQPQ